MTKRTNITNRKRLELADEMESDNQPKKVTKPLIGVIYARYSHGGNQTDQSIEVRFENAESTPLKTT